MSDALATFLFEAANFAVLAVVLAKLFFTPVRQAIADQQAALEQQVREAQEKLAAAQQLQTQIESDRRTVGAELETLRAQLRTEAERDAARLAHEAREHRERQIALLKREALHIEQAQAAKIAQAVARTAEHALRRLLQQVHGPDLEHVLLKAACRELKLLAEHELAPVTVESAAPLDEESRRVLLATLGRAAADAEFHVDPALDGGLRIATARGLVDASTAGLARYAEQSLAAEMEQLLRQRTPGDA